MTVDFSSLRKASQAKRMANMFRNTRIEIPVKVNGSTTYVQSEAVASACETSQFEHLEQFIGSMNSSELLENAYRIANNVRNTRVKHRQPKPQHEMYPAVELE